MLVYPNAKINIGLWVQEKRPDDYHAIESLFYPVSWCDILEVNKADKLELKLSGLAISGDLEKNLIYKAFEIFQKETGIKGAYLHLHKQIPMGAGLGGGSADAAFTLKALNTIYQTNLGSEKLFEMAMQLGSDCGFFIFNSPFIVSGRGELLEATEFRLSGKWIALSNPDIHVGTKEAYALIKPLKRQNFKTILSRNWTLLSNDFETPVSQKHPIIKELKNDFINNGAIYSSMTGSGSTVYGIFDKKPELNMPCFRLE